MHVAIGRVHDVSLISGFVTCIRGYYTFQGTPYHKLSALLSWDKTNTRNGIYCSQLVWYVYNQAHVDLDSNDPSYISWFVEHNKWLGLFDSNYADIAINGVFPDELRASSNITWYYDQTNP